MQQQHIIQSGDYQYTIENEGAFITKYTGKASEITIPETLNGYTVTKVLISNNSTLIVINIPKTITKITSMVGLWNLESINIDSNNSYYYSIDGVVFEKDTKKLTHYPINKSGEIYQIPEGTEAINEYAFRGNANIKELILPLSMKELPFYSLFNLEALETITISAGVEKISGNAIYYCKNLKNIEVRAENNYFSSKDGVLFNKDGTTLIKHPDNKGQIYKIPEGTQKIENYAFNHDNIKYLDIPEGLKTIGDSFGGAEFLRGIRIPDSVTYISGSAFEDAENLIIYCNPNSFAEIYAIEFGIPYDEWDEYSEDFEVINIQFEDTNLYNEILDGAIKHYYEETSAVINMAQKILNKNDENQTIQMEKQDALYVNYINITSAEIKSIKGLEHFTGLEHVWANGNEIEDIKPFENFAKLKRVDFESNSISDISPLKNSTEITMLYLGNNFKIEDISALENMTNLQELDLTGNLVNDITPLINLTNLEELYLAINSIKSINGIGNLTNLKTLTLSDNEISKISELSKLTQIETLYLGERTTTPRYNITGVTGHVIGNKIEDISALSGLVNLKTLGIDYNNIEDVSAIKELNVETLYAENQTIAKMVSLKDTQIELPQIFIDAKNENRGFYTNNCNLSDDGTKIIFNTNDIADGISIEINGGKFDGSKLTIIEQTLIFGSKEYTIENSYIKQIQAKTTIEQLKNSITTNASEANVYNENGELLEEDDIVGTGMQLELKLGEESQRMTIVVIGDVDGNGKVEISDMVVVNRARLKKKTLEGAYLLAADINEDDKIDQQDLVKINRIRLNKNF